MISVTKRVGKRRTIVIPKEISERLGIEEGTRVKIYIEKGKIVIEPVKDAIWLSLHGEKFAEITLKELEEESVERQKEYLRKGIS